MDYWLIDDIALNFLSFIKVSYVLSPYGSSLYLGFAFTTLGCASNPIELLCEDNHYNDDSIELFDSKSISLINVVLSLLFNCYNWDIIYLKLMLFELVLIATTIGIPSNYLCFVNIDDNYPRSSGTFFSEKKHINPDVPATCDTTRDKSLTAKRR